MNLPNLISIARLLSVPLITYLIMSGLMGAAFWLFIAAGISDAVDGYLAKRMNATTDLGRYLDPIADKALLVSIYVTLGAQGHLPMWLVVLVVSRDLLIVGGALLSYAAGLDVRIRPLMVSKLNTFGQIGLAALILGQLGFDRNIGPWDDVLIYAVATTTLLSGGGYLFSWLRRQSVESPS